MLKDILLNLMSHMSYLSLNIFFSKNVTWIAHFLGHADLINRVRPEAFYDKIYSDVLVRSQVGAGVSKMSLQRPLPDLYNFVFPEGAELAVRKGFAEFVDGVFGKACFEEKFSIREPDIWDVFNEKQLERPHKCLRKLFPAAVVLEERYE